MAIEFPIYYFEGNLVFSRDGSCWAYYEIPGFNYDFLSNDEKTVHYMRLKSFFWQIHTDTHLMILPHYQSIQETHEHFKKKLSGPLQQAAEKHTDDAAGQLIRLYGQEGTAYHFYIGVKLLAPEKRHGFFQELKEAWKEFISGAHETAGLDTPEMIEEDIQRYVKNERRMRSRVTGRLGGDPVNEEILQWLIRRNWYRGIGKAPTLKSWSPAYSVRSTEYEDGEVHVRRPLYHDTLRLSEGLVDESPGRSIVLRQGGDEQAGYVAFLPIANVPYEMYSRGDEWLYTIQNLDFPVEVCVRTQTIDNRKALSTVRNKQKELKDQDRHAMETNNDTSLSVIDARREAQEMEATLQKTRMPLLKTSVVLCVSASDEDELKRRTDAVKDHYQDMMIQVEQPYGDQFLLFDECLPGSKRHVKDYIHYMEPGKVAAGLFGATRQVGDGEGFFIGTTGILDQPVYISPNRAAQGIRGTKTNALSAAFTGSLGGGKSFCSNLITYLSVLSGGKALVIDPKNERGNWKDDLTELGDQKNIITLSASDEDRGRLDPFALLKDQKEAETLALNVLTFLTGVHMNDARRFPKLTEAVHHVAISDKPCMNAVVDYLLEGDSDIEKDLGGHIRSFMNLSFAQLMFGDGEERNPISLETALNVLQIQNLVLPAPGTPQERYSLSEMLSMAMMLPISSFALRFIHSDRSQFKVVLFDEAWSVLNTTQGAHLAERLVRAGRAMNAGIYFVTQNANDLLDEKMKNLIGMKFAFRSTDPEEIGHVLKLMNLKDTDANHAVLRDLQNGECLFQDIHGRCGVVAINALFSDLFDAFDTRPPAEKETAKQQVSATKE